MADKKRRKSEPQRFFRYMTGFRCAAGLKPIPAHVVKDADFRAGFDSGIRAANAARAEAGKRYGYDAKVLTLQDVELEEDKSHA